VGYAHDVQLQRSGYQGDTSDPEGKPCIIKSHNSQDYSSFLGEYLGVAA
jgi:hypothetical protein